MRNVSDDNLPDEIRIEQLLGGFKPQPSPRFHARMSSAPWLKQDRISSSARTKIGLFRMTPAWVFVVVLLALVFLTLSFIPSVRAAAGQFIHFFLPAPSYELAVQVTPVDRLDSLDFYNPSNFTRSITDVQAQAGFMVKVIPYSPIAPAFIGARYESKVNAVLLLYKGEGYDLLVTQRPLGNSQDVFIIGSNAHVESVNVGNIQAEYVIGGWNAVSTQAPIGTLTPTGTVQINAIWDDTLPQFTLRWQASGYAYELRSSGENSPSQSQLISWANELK